jgi:AcrR family transcriptional regulator
VDEPQPPLSVFKLPRGRHGIPREQIQESQRWRLLGAAAEVLAEHGYARATVSDIAAVAGVSRGTFYEQFEDLGACLLATYEMAAECVCDLAGSACGLEGEWEKRLRAALEEVLDFLVEEPALAHLLGIEAPAGVPAIAVARERLVATLTEMGVERRSLEGAFALVSERVVAGEVERLPELAPQLAELIRPRAGGPGVRYRPRSRLDSER